MKIDDVPVDAPEEVKTLHAAMVENAYQAWPDNRALAEDAVYTHFAGGEWRVGPNFEGFGPYLILDDTQTWVYRYPHDNDKPMSGGFEEAMSNALCYFTG